ncbi:hypothetical protein Ahy_A01g004440 isoform H [Arachis hypogaea]|uniref:Uncharacterized protein n=1 Tax=Arachis hypogaea TaxID=3818 RepID=A0A445EW33_ARAHY|nr:hypothetical protein Ahy_A01g004440 isoform H [Arachis hypogaea]
MKQINGRIGYTTGLIYKDRSVPYIQWFGLKPILFEDEIAILGQDWRLDSQRFGTVLGLWDRGYL